MGVHDVLATLRVFVMTQIMARYIAAHGVAVCQAQEHLDQLISPIPAEHLLQVEG